MKITRIDQFSPRQRRVWCELPPTPALKVGVRARSKANIFRCRQPLKSFGIPDRQRSAAD